MRRKSGTIGGVRKCRVSRKAYRFLLLQRNVLRRLPSGRNTVFLGRNIYPEKVTALTSLCVTVCWDRSTGMSQVSASLVPASDCGHLTGVHPRTHSAVVIPGLHVDAAPQRSFCCGYLVFASSRRTAEDNGSFHSPPHAHLCRDSEVTGAIFTKI